MASFGVSDILSVTKVVITAIKNIHDAPVELQHLGERVKSVDSILQSVNKLPSDAVAEDAHHIKGLVKRIREVSDEIKDVVVRYKKSEGWKKSYHRAKFGVWDKSGVGDLIVRLEQGTGNLTAFLVVQILLVINQTRQIFTSFCQEQERIKNQDHAQDTNTALHTDSSGNLNNPTLVSDQIDLVQSVLQRVLHSDLGYVSIEREIEVQLGQAGIEAEFTGTLIDVINKQRKQLAHPEDIDPISYIGGKNRLENPKGWIMVVDNFNEVRSIIAQTYLELVRVWTVNNSGEWLFNRVESAGVRIETKFSKRNWESQPKSLVKGGKPPEKAALKAISGKKSYFRSEEKNDILARIGQHRSRGIDNWHFRKYEYMLCFDKAAYETLNVLAKSCKEKYGDLPSYAKLARIVLVKDVKLKTAAAHLDANETEELVDSIKDGIKSFLNIQYSWQRPPKAIAGGKFRTKQIVLPNDGIKLSLDEKESKLNDIASKTGCRIRVTDEKFDGQLFSVTGPEEALSFTVSLIRKENL